MNLCKDCKHCVVAGDPQFSHCLHPQVSPNGAIAISLVTGESQPGGRAYYCSTERSAPSGSSFPCGTEGRLFEPSSAPERKLHASPKAIGLECSETARD